MNDYVHIEAADLRRPNARFTTERQGYQVLTPFGKLGYSPKHPLGLWEGSTENTTVCQGLLTNLQRRGLRTDRSLLVILDGGQALHTAVSQTFGRAALVQRCQVHKRRNVLEHLPEVQRPWVLPPSTVATPPLSRSNQTA